MKNGAILCIGEALIDMICTDKGMALSDGNHFLKKAGGAPMNVAAAIGALGGSVTVAAKVGDDPFGKHLIDVLRGFNVNTRHIISTADHFTTFAFVSLMENGERDFYFNRGADGMLNTEEVDAIDTDAFSIIHFGSATGFLPGPLQQAYMNLLEKARERTQFISFDPNYRSLLFGNNTSTFIERSWHFIKAAHFVKVSDEEALLITGAGSVAEAMEQFFRSSNAVFAITIGKEGTLLGYKKEMLTVPSTPVDPVDTTGAGDAFVGAVLYQLSRNTPEQIQEMDSSSWCSIISNANKAGARTCAYMGAMEAFRYLGADLFS